MKRRKAIKIVGQRKVDMAERLYNEDFGQELFPSDEPKYLSDSFSETQLEYLQYARMRKIRNYS